ncbi:MAG: methyltransferase domain-containing protein, partial [Candidatus Acidiferrales bacterium]
ATTRTLAELVGPSGSVTGVDVSAAQLEQGRNLCKAEGITNTFFVEASATATGLPRNSFDLVYCRYLLLHLVDPSACLREMKEILKPGGILVVEDGDLTSAGSSPASSLQWFADLFGRLGPTRGLDYTLGNRLYHLVKAAGFPEPDIEIHQPAIPRGEERFLLKWTMDEAAPAFIAAGLVTATDMNTILADMDRDSRDPNILPLAPRMSLVWARKPN